MNTERRKPPNAGKGRPKGSRNKSPGIVREAISKLLESNVDNFSVWLKAVAEGEREFEPELDEDGMAVIGDNGEPKGTWSWLRRPEPGVALKLAMDMTEFHIPKLARTELTGDGGKPLQIQIVDPTRRANPAAP